jgi:hypothetical protein
VRPGDGVVFLEIFKRDLWIIITNAGPVSHGTYWLARAPFDSYLVDPASSHMLVSKIKPCMSKYKQICTVKLRMAH